MRTAKKIEVLCNVQLWRNRIFSFKVTFFVSCYDHYVEGPLPLWLLSNLLIDFHSQCSTAKISHTCNTCPQISHQNKDMFIIIFQINFNAYHSLFDVFMTPQFYAVLFHHELMCTHVCVHACGEEAHCFLTLIFNHTLLHNICKQISLKYNPLLQWPFHKLKCLCSHNFSLALLPSTYYTNICMNTSQQLKKDKFCTNQVSLG